MSGPENAWRKRGEFPPRPVTAGGRSDRAALALVAVVVVGVVGLALLGQQAVGEEPGIPVAARPSAAAEGMPPNSSSSTSSARAPLPRAALPPRVAVSLAAAPSCPAGSTPDKPGPVDQARPPRSGITAMAFDRDSGRIVLLASAAGSPETWTFDVCRNTWTLMQPAGGPPREAASGAALVHDVRADLTIAVGGDGSTWAYDLEADTWTEKGAAPAAGRLLLLYDPVADRVIATSTTAPVQIWAYDVDGDEWTRVIPSNAPSRRVALLAYDSSVDRILAPRSLTGWGAGTLLLDPRAGRWSEARALVPAFSEWFLSGGEIAYDEAGQRTVVFSDGLVIAYDAASDRWETLYETDPAMPDEWTAGTARVGHWMVYDSVNERLVVYGGWARRLNDWVQVEADDVLAFDPAAGTWTVLLEPSEPH
jgi:hypothetical protein